MKNANVEQIDLNEMKAIKLPTFRAAVSATGRGLKKLRRPALILLLILAVAHAGLNIYASVLLNRELAELRQKGEPLTLGEMAPPLVPEAENAAPLYRQAFAAREIKHSEELKLDKLLSQDARLDAAGQAILQRNQQALRLARRAAARPFCRFDSNWSQAVPPPEIPLPQYAEMRMLARLLRVQAVQDARSGDLKSALSNIHAIYRMSDHLSQEPLLIGFLLARALDAIASRALDDVLQIQSVPAAQGQAFAASLPRADLNRSFLHALSGERVFGLWTLESSRSDPVYVYNMFVPSEDYLSVRENTMPALPAWFIKPLVILWAPFSKLDEVCYLRFFKQRLAALPPLQMPLQGTDVDDDSGFETPFYAVLTRAILPGISRSTWNRDRAEVLLLQKQNALAISAFRAAHNGAYPTNLQQAATAWNAPLLLDPYNAQPFQYRVEDNGFLLYSVGPNRVDDGGYVHYERAFPAQGVPPTADDILWGIARLARKNQVKSPQ